MQRIRVIDSHTGGEPTRVVVEGFPALDGGTMSAKLDALKALDGYRRATVCEPRASEVVVGAVLTPPVTADAVAGVIFFNNVGYLGMCGHGTIGVVATLAYMGRIGAGSCRIDTPVGTVACRYHDDGSVSVENVASYRHAAGVRVPLPNGGEAFGDVAWGGNWFFLTDAPTAAVSLAHLSALDAYAREVKEGLVRTGVTGADGAEIDHVELFSATATANSRSFVLCPGNAYDRSPCGTGTSAKLACLAADGILGPGETWVQESVIGSRFEAHYRWLTDAAGEHIVPTIRGRAHLSAEATLLLGETDPFAWGITG